MIIIGHNLIKSELYVSPRHYLHVGNNFEHPDSIAHFLLHLQPSLQYK